MKVNQLKAGVILSYFNLILSSIIPLIYTPIMLKILGQEEYGLYSLSLSTVGYLSLLSFGFGSTIIRYISKYRAEDNVEKVKDIFGFFLLLYTALGFLVVFCGLLISNNVEFIFSESLSNLQVSKMKKLVLIMAINCALSFPASVFSSLIISYERYFYRRIIDVLSTILSPIANIIALFLGYMSIGMACAGTFVQFIVLPVNILYCFNVLRIKPTFRKISNSLVKEMIGFSVFVFIGAMVDMLFWATDKVILGVLVGATSVAIYNVGGTFNSMVISLSTSISGVLVPKITGMVVTETPREKLSGLFIKIGRLQFIIIALIVSGFSVFGRSFIKLWAGPDYANAYWVALLTMFPLCIPLIQNTGLSIITAQNKHQFRSIVYLIIAIINVVSTYLCIPYFDVIGAALCSCVSYLVGQGIIMNIYYYKEIKLDIPLFWINILKMSVIPAVMMITGLFLVKFIHLNSWITFLSGVLSYTVIYAILMYHYTLNDYEKDLFRKPFFMVMKKIRRG